MLAKGSRGAVGSSPDVTGSMVSLYYGRYPRDLFVYRCFGKSISYLFGIIILRK